MTNTLLTAEMKSKFIGTENLRNLKSHINEQYAPAFSSYIEIGVNDSSHDRTGQISMPLGRPLEHTSLVCTDQVSVSGVVPHGLVSNDLLTLSSDSSTSHQTKTTLSPGRMIPSSCPKVPNKVLNISHQKTRATTSLSGI